MSNAAATPVALATLPWSDRGEPSWRDATLSPRSGRDVDILRAIGRRINRADPGALNNLGVVYYNKGLIEEAVRNFEEALEVDARMQVAERNLQIAYFATGYFETLVRQLRARLQEDAEDAVARNRLARVYFYGGDADASIREWRGVLHTRPRDAGIYQNIARAESKRGDLDAALIALRNAAAIQPRNARIQLRIGEVLYLRGLHSEAREPLEKAVTLDDTLAEAFHLLAFVYGDLGQGEKANRAAARAGELNPSLNRAERNLSLDRYSEARYEELVGERSARMGVAEGGALAHYNLGLAFRQKALWDEALREFRLATERGEDPFLVSQAQAEMMLLRGSGAEGVAVYEELLEQEPASPKLWNELGVARHQTGQMEAAEVAYRRSLALDPVYPLAWNNLGVALHHRGATREAEAAFRSALTDGRAAKDVWRNLGLLMQRTGRRDEAADAYRHAVDIDPNSALAWTGLGTLFLERSAPQRAREALLRAVEADPDLAEARYQLAFALSAVGDYPGALRETQRALELNPYMPQARFRLLVDLQYEEAGVLAPELDAPEHIGVGAGIETFEYQGDGLDAVFAGAPIPPVPQPSGETAHAGVPDVLVPSAPASIESLAAARASLERGDPVGSQAHAQRAAAAGANRIEVLLLLGDIFLARGLAGEAIERFTEVGGDIERLGEAAVASVVGEDALRRALMGMARSLTDLGRTVEAIDAAERLRTLAPAETNVQLTLADALLRSGDAARAVQVLEAARVGAPNDFELLTRLGRAYQARGDSGRAENAYREAVARNAQVLTARVALGRLLGDANRLEEAAAEFRGALEVLPSYGDAALALADLEASRGNGQVAVNALVDLLTVDPYHLAALVRLGDMLCLFGRQREAAVAYRRVLRFDPGYVEALRGLERLSPSEVLVTEDASIELD
jgi:tetratricopeptide (TPR) repeat protein